MSGSLVERGAATLETKPDIAEPASVAARLIGRTPTSAEQTAAASYDDLRAILRMAREDTPLKQKDIAQVMGIPQSEVSRLETTIGPGTRFGRLSKYLAACGAELVLNVRTAQGHQLTWDAHGSTLAVAEPRAVSEGHLSEPGVSPVIAGRLEMLDDILDLEEALYNAEVSSDDAARVMHAFLTRLRARHNLARQNAGIGRPEQSAYAAADYGLVHR